MKASELIKVLQEAVDATRDCAVVFDSEGCVFISHYVDVETAYFDPEIQIVTLHFKHGPNGPGRLVE